MLFSLRETYPGFQGGKHEGSVIRTVPIAKRKGRTADADAVMAYVTYMPSSLASVPTRFMYPSPPAPGDVAVLTHGPYMGFIVDVDKQALHNGDLMVVARGYSYRAAYHPQYLIKVVPK